MLFWRLRLFLQGKRFVGRGGSVNEHVAWVERDSALPLASVVPVAALFLITRHHHSLMRRKEMAASLPADEKLSVVRLVGC